MGKKLLACLLAAMMLLSLVGASAEIRGDDYFGKSTSFSYMIANGIEGFYFDEYQDAPCLQYVLSKDWDPDGNGNTRKIGLTVLTPPGGGEADYANTLVATGDYPDVMNIQIMSMSAAEMYDEGMALDITEYVEKYMPNYMAWFERHPLYAGKQYTMVDGEKKILCLYHTDEVMPGAWGGMLYRRDWIVNYGKNPVTGEAFSGAWEEDGNWKDDVVFPSGETYPKTVSDWEWMIEIFQNVITSMGLNQAGGYAVSCKADGTFGVWGDMASGFGGINGWYYDVNTGKVVNGFASKGFRTYLQMMNAWWNNGWINPAFQEHANDMFFLIDMAATYGGMIGTWYGLTSQLGAGLDTGASPLTTGAVVFAAPTPINDKYGDESVQGITPFMYYATEQLGAQLVITDKAKDKDLPALFTFLDYFYSEEGGVMVAMGLSKEQVEECRTVAPGAAELYDKWGLSEGAYTVTDEGKYLKDPKLNSDGNLAGASCLVRFNGNTDESNLDRGFLPYYQEQMDLLHMYEVTGSIGTEITSQLTPDESSRTSEILNDITTYCNIELPKFITGEKNINDDAAWDAFCQQLAEYGADEYCEIYNRIYGAE